MAVWTHIAHTSLSLPAQTVTWSSISGSYDHLFIKASIRDDGSNYLSWSLMRFNDDTTNAYGNTRLYTSSNAPVSSTSYLHAESGCWGQIAGASATAGCFSNMEIWIPNYSNSTGFKSVLVHSVVESKSTTNSQWLISQDAHLWHETDAITQIDLLSYYDDFVAYSTFDLYGIKGA
tara:strand:- start:130 stop:657 length:528 start_codon:yes stop_codon:yes gene_type:complete